MKNGCLQGHPFDEFQPREALILKTCEDDVPFNYPKITVYRKDYAGGEFHSIEFINHTEEFAGKQPVDERQRRTRRSLFLLHGPHDRGGEWMMNHGGHL